MRTSVLEEDAASAFRVEGMWVKPAAACNIMVPIYHTTGVTPQKTVMLTLTVVRTQNLQCIYICSCIHTADILNIPHPYTRHPVCNFTPSLQPLSPADAPTAAKNQEIHL
jgi:hypothetical protein